MKNSGVMLNHALRTVTGPQRAKRARYPLSIFGMKKISQPDRTGCK